MCVCVCARLATHSRSLPADEGPLLGGEERAEGVVHGQEARQAVVGLGQRQVNGYGDGEDARHPSVHERAEEQAGDQPLFEARWLC